MDGCIIIVACILYMRLNVHMCVCTYVCMYVAESTTRCEWYL